MRLTTVVLLIWVFAVIVLAVTSSKGRTVYWLSVVLAIPGVFISQKEYGLLPMAGILHAFAAGIYPFGLFLVVRLFKCRT